MTKVRHYWLILVLVCLVGFMLAFPAHPSEDNPCSKEYPVVDFTQEEYEEQQGEIRKQQVLVEEKQVRQQDLIESQAEEITRLRREAELIKRQQAYRSAQRAQEVLDLSALKSTAVIEEEEEEPEDE